MNGQVAVGDGVFEAVKVIGGRPFALDLHLQRLARGAVAVGLPEPDEDAVRRDVVAALGAAHLELGRLRITCTAGAGTRVTAAATGEPAETTTVVTAPWPRNQLSALAGLKATAYADNVLALAQAVERGAGEAVLADLAGRLCEGTTTNVFYVVDGELRTPTLDSGCLPGVTRALVLGWYGAREVDEPLEEVRARASEVFLAGTVREVQGVGRWDDRQLPTPGPVTRAVRDAWRARVPELLGF